MYNFQLRLLTKYIIKMTEQRQKLLDEFNKWFDSNPNKRIIAAQCANIAEKYAAEQLKLYGVGSSTYKISISDSFCTYDFEMELPKTTCIRDISRRLYASFGLKEDNGRLRK